MRNNVSDQAIDCFAHGVAHLISELGAVKGVRKGIDVLERLADSDLSDLVGETDHHSQRRTAELRRPSHHGVGRLRIPGDG